jgi:hypothetical protein
MKQDINNTKERIMTHIVTQDDIRRLENTGLPKWPQMLVWGKPVTVTQARDIILRTDRFFTDIDNFPGGHNRRWIEWAQQELGFRHLVEDESRAGCLRRNEAEDVLRRGLCCIETEYVHNTWASSSFIHGPYGWCHPDGTLWYEHNIGKHPNAREVFEEWQALAAAFPYVDATVTLFSGERLEEDRVPVVSFRVQEGHVQLLPEPVVPSERPVPPFESTRRFASYEDEVAASNGLDDQWIRDFGAVTRSLLANFR